MAVQYQRLSEATIGNIHLNQTSTIAQAKTEISRQHKVDRSLVDIISDGVVADDDILVSTIRKPLQVVIHVYDRKVPSFYESTTEDVINRHMEDEPRWDMSCGHGITAENLFGLCWSKLNAGEFKFVCPGLDRGCGREWDFYEVQWKARLNDDERIYFESRISSNMIRKQSSVRECPFCQTICERLAEGNSRVRCSKCSLEGKPESEYCWFCLMPWREGHFCGQDRIRQTLQTCGTKTISEIPNVPSVRSCMKCGLLLEHTSGCKQMTCKCNQRFCFVCLTPCRPNGSFQCRTPCKVASRQTV